MTVAYAYFRYIINRETNKAFIYLFSGPSDVRIILEKTPEVEWRIMGNAAGTQAQQQGTEKEGDSKDISQDVNKFSMKEESGSLSGKAMKINYIIISVFTILLCIAVIAVSISTAMATQVYCTEHSGRVVAMIVLAVTAACTMSMVIYGLLGSLRTQTKPLQITAVLLLILVIIQCVICGVSVRLTTKDETNLIQSLSESFKTAKPQNSRLVKLWGLTQNNLNCCGVNGPEDYRTASLPIYFPPDIPISCCPGYNSDRSDLVQERERERCKARRQFFTVGCSTPVIQLFRETADLVMWVTVVMILSETVLIIMGLIMYHKAMDAKKLETEAEQTKEKP